MFPKLRSAIITVVTLLIIVILLWLIARLAVLFKGELSVNSQCYSMTGRYGFGTIRLQCDKSNIENVTIRRTPFDYRHRHCTVILRTSYKGRDSVKLKYLDYGKVSELLELKIK